METGRFNDCSLCAELIDGSRAALPDGLARAVTLDDDWTVLPSLGPIGPIHLLLVPRGHAAISLSVSNSARLVSTAMTAFRRLVDEGRSIVAFEHANSPTGCGVTHAHVHLVSVPLSFDPEAAFTAARVQRIANLADLAGERGELFWCADGADRLWASKAGPFQSQSARRAVALQNGVDFNTDWKSYTHRPWFEASAQTARALAQRLRSKQTAARSLIA